MNQRLEVSLRPIGRVASGRSSAARDDQWEEAIAEIEIDPAWAGALDGIGEFSHIWVLWWLDRFEGPPDFTHVRAERREEMPLVGIFATRSPRRPNPLAMTAVRLIEHKGGQLYVQGLDAYEGTPVLDIKPYLPRGDSIPEAAVPTWLEELWGIHDRERDTR
jgi:tRNA-Thr(GGU) m(6)t(6)A37 methyltransferase TsaA